MPWLMLTPRELELIFAHPPLDTHNGRLLGRVQALADRSLGELTLTDDDVAQVRAAARNWQGGHEKAMRAILSAVDRHS